MKIRGFSRGLLSSRISIALTIRSFDLFAQLKGFLSRSSIAFAIRSVDRVASYLSTRFRSG